MQTIDWVEHENKGNWKRPNLVAYTLIEAMSGCTESGNIKEFFAPFDSSALQVELTVNGKQVDFVKAMGLIQSAILNLENEIRKDLEKEVAQDLIAKLEKIVNLEY